MARIPTHAVDDAPAARPLLAEMIQFPTRRLLNMHARMAHAPAVLQAYLSIRRATARRGTNDEQSAPCSRSSRRPPTAARTHPQSSRHSRCGPGGARTGSRRYRLPAARSQPASTHSMPFWRSVGHHTHDKIADHSGGFVREI
jgi:hypothetical protein